MVAQRVASLFPPIANDVDDACWQRVSKSFFLGVVFFFNKNTTSKIFLRKR